MLVGHSLVHIKPSHLVATMVSVQSKLVPWWAHVDFRREAWSSANVINTRSYRVKSSCIFKKGSVGHVTLSILCYYCKLLSRRKNSHQRSSSRQWLVKYDTQYSCSDAFGGGWLKSFLAHIMSQIRKNRLTPPMTFCWTCLRIRCRKLFLLGESKSTLWSVHN